MGAAGPQPQTPGLPHPLDSAAALARTALFAGLSRVELATLAGELEELSFAAGDVVVREGEPGDALYVIKSGTAAVRAPEDTPGARARVMIAGEEFGEMALLAGGRRTATVAAHTALEVWRLPAERFRALLEQDRSLAISLARALSQRLMASSQERADLGRRAATMTVLAREMLPPDVAMLLARLSLAPAWPTDLVEEVCDLFGQSATLADLRGRAGLLARADDVLAVEPSLAALFAGTLLSPDRAWLLAAISALLERGQPASAFRVAARTGAVEEALVVLVEHRAALLDELGSRELSALLGGLAASEPEHAEEIAPILGELEADPGAAGSAEVDAAAEPAGWVEEARSAAERARASLGVARSQRSRRLVGAALALALYALGWLAAPPPGLERAGVVAVAAVLATAALLVFRALPDYAVGLLLAAALAAPGLVPASLVLDGFASPSWVTMVALLAIGAAIARSGLLYRAALWSLDHLGGSLVVQTLGLSVVAFVLSAGVTNGSPRLALAVPAARGVADALRYRAGSREAAALGLVTYLGFGELTALFSTSSSAALLLQGLLPDAAQSQFGWGRWFLAGLLPSLLFFTLSYLAILALCRPALRTSVDRRRVRVQRQLLGPVTRDELVSGGALLVLMLGFATQGYHGLGVAWIAVAVLTALVAVGALDAHTFQSGVAWGLVVYMGVMLGLGAIVPALGLDRAIAAGVGSAMRGPLVGSPYGFVATVALAAILLHFVMPLSSASPIIALVAMPLAIAAGYSPFIPAIVCLIAGDHAALPYTNSAYLTFQFAGGGELVGEAPARPYLALGPALRLIALLASVPYWQALGLLEPQRPAIPVIATPLMK